MLISCPICHIEAKFDSRVRYFTCPSCRHMFEYDGNQAIDLGKCPVEPDPNAILRLGDRGHVRGRPFEVVTVLYLSEDPQATPLTYSTEWIIRLSDGRIASLDIYDGELYYETSRVEPVSNLPPFEELTEGDVINVNGHVITVEEISSVVVIGSEGSFAYPGPGQTLRIVEATFRNYEVCLEYTADKVFMHFSMATSLDDLVIENRDSAPNRPERL